MDFYRLCDGAYINYITLLGGRWGMGFCDNMNEDATNPPKSDKSGVNLGSKLRDVIYECSLTQLGGELIGRGRPALVFRRYKW